MRYAVAFVSGLLFALGLGLAGMLQPAKIIAFLDVLGAWDPSLAFVMGGAIPVAALGFWLGRRRRAPHYNLAFATLPPRTLIDTPLLAGAVLFGGGWALAGYCPGPGIVSVLSGATSAFVFLGTLAVGMVAHDLARSRVGEDVVAGTGAAPASPR